MAKKRRRRPISALRKYGKDEYHISGVAKQKTFAQAKKEANRIRRKGFPARVEKHPNKTATVFVRYTTYKKKRR